MTTFREAGEIAERERAQKARNRLRELISLGDKADPRDVARADAAVHGPSDALVTEAIRHSWLVRTGQSLDSCCCVRCSSRPRSERGEGQAR